MVCARCSIWCDPSTRKTATYGHFGRTEPEFTWERTDLAQTLAAEAKDVRAA